MDAKAVLFAGLGMAGASVAMSLGRATVAPRKDTPPELVEINKMIDAHFADAYTDAPLEPKRHRDPVGNEGGELQASYESDQPGLQASYSFGQTAGRTRDFNPDYHPDFQPAMRGGW